jgi:glycerol kinase
VTSRDYVVAIDQGTTSTRCIVFDRRGQLVSVDQREHAQHFPRPGWVEQDAMEIWRNVEKVVPRALARAGIDAGQIAAVGIANQRETTVVWDRSTLQPAHPAIVWQDRRTAALCDRLREEGWEEAVRERTGLVIDPYFSATKLAWLLEEVEGLGEAAATSRVAFGTVDSYLVARLTGGRVHATDHSNASRTMLYDIHRLSWDEELLARLHIPTSVLPEVGTSIGEFGTTDPDAFFGARVPVSGIAGDQQAALVGQACFEPGDAKNTYGTGSFLLLNTGEKPAGGSGLLTTIAYSDAGAVRYALEGSIFVTGAAIQWLRDGLEIIARSDEAGPVAASVPDTGGVYFVPALVGLGSPWWDPYARGVIAGLTRGTTRAHVVRAAVEAMAYQTRDVADAMVRASGTSLSALKADGGASVMNVLLQFQADLLGVPVRRPVQQETTALGAAYLAGLAAGVWSSTDQVAEAWQLDREFMPGDTEEADRLYEGWRRAAQLSLGWERPG